MNIYEFLKELQEGIGDDCRVGASLWSFSGNITGIRIDVVWFDAEGNRKYTYKCVIPAFLLGNEGFLEHFCKETIERASRAFRIAEVGED